MRSDAGDSKRRGEVGGHGQAHGSQADHRDVRGVGLGHAVHAPSDWPTLRSVATTAASARSSPTLPAKTMYGMPAAGPATGSQSETMPGNMLPRVQARLMPN